MLRVPLCLGIGAVFTRLLRQPRRAHVRKRRVPTGVLVGGLVALVLGLAQPAVAMNLRTPGWRGGPDVLVRRRLTTSTRPRVNSARGSCRAPVSACRTGGGPPTSPSRRWRSRPGSLGHRCRWPHPRPSGSSPRSSGSSSRAPGRRTSGRRSAGWASATSLVRHDLDEQASETTTSNLVSIALARSRGIERVATFGALELGPAIELYRVTSSDVAPELEVRPLDDAVTVASASSDVVSAVTEGLVSRRQPVVVQGDKGWDRPADIVGDTLPRPGAQLRSGALRRGTGAGAGRASVRRSGGAGLSRQRALEAGSRRLRGRGARRRHPRRRDGRTALAGWTRSRRRTPRSTVTSTRDGARASPASRTAVVGDPLARAPGDRAGAHQDTGRRLQDRRGDAVEGLGRAASRSGPWSTRSRAWRQRT